jgi:hypothetical protein
MYAFGWWRLRLGTSTAKNRPCIGLWVGQVALMNARLQISIGYFDAYCFAIWYRNTQCAWSTLPQRSNSIARTDMHVLASGTSHIIRNFHTLEQMCGRTLTYANRVPDAEARFTNSLVLVSSTPRGSQYSSTLEMMIWRVYRDPNHWSARWSSFWDDTGYRPIHLGWFVCLHSVNIRDVDAMQHALGYRVTWHLSATDVHINVPASFAYVPHCIVICAFHVR